MTTGTLIRREAVAHVERKREEIDVESLGGAVAVVEMTLTARLEIEKATKALKENAAESVYATIPLVLAVCVVDADGEPLMSAEQWQVFGSRNREVAVHLFNTAMAFSGFGEDAEKN